MKRNKSILVVILALLAVWLAAYFAAIRPWFLNWGANAEEISRVLPGQELAPAGAVHHTRAITINAPPEKVWPWQAQLGIGRAGFYSYSWLENLFGSGIHNIYRIVPEWQGRKAGDFVRSFQFGAEKPGSNGWTMEPFEDGKYFFLNPSWGPFVLEPQSEGRTRLLIRSWTLPMNPAVRTLMGLFFDPIHFTMEKRMMIEVARLAEGRPRAPAWATILSWAGFGLAGLIAAGVILTRKRKKFWIFLPLLWALGCGLAAKDLQAALVAFTASGLIIAGFRAFGRKGWAWVAGFWIYADVVLIFSRDAFIFFGLAFLAASVVFLAGAVRRKKA